MENLTFEELALSNELQKAIEEIGYTTPSPIQALAIPAILEGKDIIGQAQTGTGKTAAFGIPAVQMASADSKNPECIVLCPTRELALQVAKELKKLSAFKKGLVILPIYGGESIDRQISNLKRKTQIIVGTPGRVIDHLNRKSLKLDDVKMVILDEADEMLNMGFREDIESILERTPGNQQTILFSATMPAPIMSLAKKFQKNPQLIKVAKKELAVPLIEQIGFDVREKDKMQLTTYLLDKYNVQLSLLFANTKKRAEEIAEELKSMNYKAEAIHGDLRQAQRNNVMSKFRNGELQLLIATDVAARGIDVENVDAVFNYDLPQDPEYYVHRIGRTGRAGKSGIAFTYITGREETYRLRDIEKATSGKVKKLELPTAAELAEHQKAKILSRLKPVLEKPAIVKKQLQAIEDLKEEGFTAEEIAAGILALYLGVSTEEKPAFSERSDRERGRDRDRSDRGDRGDRDRGDRGDRGGRSRKSSISEGMIRLFINVGKKDRVSPGDIVGAFAGEAKISGKDIGQIDIYDKFSFVNVNSITAEKIMHGMKNNSIKGRKINIEIAKQ